MFSPEELQDIVNRHISRLGFNNVPAELYEPVRYILSGEGKRIRPVLVLLSCNMFSDEIHKAINPATGMEVFHNFTLIHDDMMDNADVRRNKETIHKKWNYNIGLLSGDAMMIKSYDFFFGLEPKLLAKVLPVFNDSALKVCEGQQFDMNYESVPEISPEEYIGMITLKTAVLLGCCLKIGAIIGGACDKDADLLYNFGINTGISFQLLDDYLDVYGNQQNFGKKIGGDIIAGKKTWLLVTLLNSEENELKKKVFEILQNETDPVRKVSLVTNLYDKYNITERTIAESEKYFTVATGYLNELKLEAGRKRILEQYAFSLLKRTR